MLTCESVYPSETPWMSDPCGFADRDMFCRYAGVGGGHEALFPVGRFQTVSPRQKPASDVESTDEYLEMSEEGDGLHSLSTDSSGYGCEDNARASASGDDSDGHDDDGAMADLEELDGDNDSDDSELDPDGTDEEECIGSNSESEDDDFTDGEDMISAFRF